MELPLSICYEDDDILVVNKPAGMPVHPSRGNETPSLANAVCGYYKALGIPYTFRCVNRLDKDTSGLVILAKHMLSAAILNGAIARRDIRREYLALVYGHPGTSGTIDAPIRRASCDGILREVHPGGPACRHPLPGSSCCRGLYTYLPAFRDRSHPPDPRPHDAHRTSAVRRLSVRHFR